MQGGATDRNGAVMRFVCLNGSFEQSIYDPRYQRVITLTAAELWQSGLNEDGRYEGDKWGGKYLRAPAIYFTILERGRGKLVRLGDIAKVRIGIATGANDFFYLKPIELCVSDLLSGNAGATVLVRNGAGWVGEIETEWLHPLLKSPRELKTLRVRPEDLQHLVFMPPDTIRENLTELVASGELERRYPYAWAYIQWGERQGYHTNSTCVARKLWWLLEAKQSPIKIPMIYGARIFVVETTTFSDTQLYNVIVEQGNALKSDLVFALLNSTMLVFQAELGGRNYCGALKFQVYEAKNCLLLNPAVLTDSQRERLLEAFDTLAKREVKSIFEELGLPAPNRDYSNIRVEDVLLERVLPDRRALDAVVFEVLGLNEQEQLAVYRAVVELVKGRLAKAQCVRTQRYS